jgi:diaminohydroxyphosphoribosylaminopyrimidine deaminase / 5-amino-6-(5-phosphoribosylamino)uracil reductase
MGIAIELAWQCPPSSESFSVGALIVAVDGTELARGFSREDGDSHVHAEEAALAKLAPGMLTRGDDRLAGATLYSTLEPCSQRKSRPLSCTELILATRRDAGNGGIGRVVIAWREPSLFVADCQGAALLRQAGIEVTELVGLAESAKAPNRHLDV